MRAPLQEQEQGGASRQDGTNAEHRALQTQVVLPPGSQAGNPRALDGSQVTAAQVVMLRTLHDQLSSQLADTNAAAAGLARLVAMLRSRWQETIQANLRLRAALHQTAGQGLAPRLAGVRPRSRPPCSGCRLGTRPRLGVRRRLPRRAPHAPRPSRASARVTCNPPSLRSTTPILEAAAAKRGSVHAPRPNLFPRPRPRASRRLSVSLRPVMPPVPAPVAAQRACVACAPHTVPPLQHCLLPRRILRPAARLASARGLQRRKQAAAQPSGLAQPSPQRGLSWDVSAPQARAHPFR